MSIPYWVGNLALAMLPCNLFKSNIFGMSASLEIPEGCIRFPMIVNWIAWFGFMTIVSLPDLSLTIAVVELVKYCTIHLSKYPVLLINPNK